MLELRTGWYKHRSPQRRLLLHCSGLWTTALFSKMAAVGNFQGFQWILSKILSQNKLPLADPQLNIRELGASCLALLLLPLAPQTSATSCLCQLHPNHRLTTTATLSQVIQTSVFFNTVIKYAQRHAGKFLHSCFFSSLLFGDYLNM